MNVTVAPEFVDPQELLSADETAKLLGVSTHSLSAWRYEKRGPAYYKVGESV
jgi:hypothetical protein